VRPDGWSPAGTRFSLAPAVVYPRPAENAPSRGYTPQNAAWSSPSPLSTLRDRLARALVGGLRGSPPCAISIAPEVRTERAGSFNTGMKLTPGRLCSAPLADCSLPFAVKRSIVAPLPGAAYP
jgi:hypothetical protein